MAAKDGRPRPPPTDANELIPGGLSRNTDLIHCNLKHPLKGLGQDYEGFCKWLGYEGDCHDCAGSEEGFIGIGAIPRLMGSSP